MAISQAEFENLESRTGNVEQRLEQVTSALFRELAKMEEWRQTTIARFDAQAEWFEAVNARFDSLERLIRESNQHNGTGEHDGN